MKELYGLKPQDIIILVKLIAEQGRGHVFQSDLAREIGISPAEFSNGIARLKGSRLINSDIKPVRQSAIEFLISGVKYMYPATPGPITRGIPTAHSAAPLNQKFRTAPNDIYVWPDSQGEVSGQAVTPIYKSASIAASGNIRVYEILSLIDALRVGRAREVEVAKEELKQRLRAKT